MRAALSNVFRAVTLGIGVFFFLFFFGVLGHLFKQLYPCVLSGVGECECVRLLSVAQDSGLWTHRSIDGTFE